MRAELVVVADGQWFPVPCRPGKDWLSGELCRIKWEREGGTRGRGEGREGGMGCGVHDCEGISKSVRRGRVFEALTTRDSFSTPSSFSSLQQ